MAGLSKGDVEDLEKYVDDIKAKTKRAREVLLHSMLARHRIHLLTVYFSSKRQSMASCGPKAMYS